MEYIRKELYDDIMSNSNVVTGDEYRELVCAVAQVSADMVVKTLGPYGSTTVIDDGTGFTYPSKDGWTCLNKLMFVDPTYNTIFQMLKKISFNSVSTVGDGTTSAMVAASKFLRSMYTDFIPKITQNGAAFRQATFVESMQRVSRTLEKALKKNPNIRQIDPEGDFEDIYRIAYVATNGNEEFARLIQNIYQETGNPNIQVTLDGNASKASSEIQKGYKFDAHVLNFNAYMNDPAELIVYKDEPRKVVIFDHNVSFQTHEKIIGSLLGISKRANTSMIIMAPYFDDIITAWMDAQAQKMIQMHQIPSLMMVQVPITMDIHRKTLYDLTVMTNCRVFDNSMVQMFNLMLHNQTHEEKDQVKDEALETLISQNSFESPEDVLNSCLGTIRTITLNKKGEGFLQDYEGIYNKTLYDALVAEVKADYTNRKDKALKSIGGMLDKEFLFSQLRYIKLTGNMGVIRVGAPSDIQQHTDKDTIDDAVLACRSAFENGYVRGMNLEILSMIHQLRNIENRDGGEPYEYYNDILDMLYSCFYLTSYEVIRNKHADNTTRRLVCVGDREYAEDNPDEIIEDSVVYHLSSSEILDMCITDPKTYDYNLREEHMHEPSHWNVINSTATDIEILRAVVNVLTTVVTSNQFLSVSRRFDRRVADQKALETRMKEDRQIFENRARSVVKGIVSGPYAQKLQNTLGYKLVVPTLESTESVPGKGVQVAPLNLRDPENGQLKSEEKL